MQYTILKKERLNDFITFLVKEQKVVAPVEKGYNNFTFAEVENADNISLHYIPTILPPKKYFMTPNETLLEYNIIEGQKLKAVVEYENLILFGVHTCDLAGIQCLNIAFADRPKDINYLIRKNEIIVIGLECSEYCDSYASCKLMENHLPNGGYDLFFTDIGKEFIVHINTQSGERLVKNRLFEPVNSSHFDMLEKFREKKRQIFKNELSTDISQAELYHIFEQSFHHPVWDELDARCLSCGNCTNTCPTCYCFDVFDEPDLDLKTGRRKRVWDSCQNEPFAKVAGGENFREKRKDRQRHRFYRKFKYLKDKFSRFYCTGCGRCTRSCMAKISLKETLNTLISSASKK